MSTINNELPNIVIPNMDEYKPQQSPSILTKSPSILHKSPSVRYNPSLLSKNSPTQLKSRLDRNSQLYNSIDMTSKNSYGLSTLQKRNLDINPKGSPRMQIVYKDPFTAKQSKTKPMNKNLEDINVDLFRPENQHLLQKWERNLQSDPFIMQQGYDTSPRTLVPQISHSSLHSKNVT